MFRFIENEIKSHHKVETFMDSFKELWVDFSEKIGFS